MPLHEPGPGQYSVTVEVNLPELPGVYGMVEALSKVMAAGTVAGQVDVDRPPKAGVLSPPYLVRFIRQWGDDVEYLKTRIEKMGKAVSQGTALSSVGDAARQQISAELEDTDFDDPTVIGLVDALRVALEAPSDAEEDNRVGAVTRSMLSEITEAAPSPEPAVPSDNLREVLGDINSKMDALLRSLSVARGIAPVCPGPIRLALAEVRKHCPTVTQVFYGSCNRWMFCDENFDVPPFFDRVDVGILEAAADAVPYLPCAFQWSGE